MIRLQEKSDWTATAGGNLFDANLEILRRQQPDVAVRVRDAAEDPELVVRVSRSGVPVPCLRGKALNSLEDPASEARQVFQGAMKDPAQDRLIFFGFGFGHHLRPFIEAGFSATVVEPSAAMLREALRRVDLRGILPFVILHLGDAVPDVPRKTKLFAIPAMADLFPGLVAQLSGKIITDMPARTDDIEEGVYYASYRNVTCLKNPCDLAVYQMLIFQVRPTLLIEIGTCKGGSALYFWDLLKILGGDRRLYTYDVSDEAAPEIRGIPGLHYVLGGHRSFDPSIIRPDDRVLVIEDSAHSYENTLEVLNRFAPYVNPNSYLVVEDGYAGEGRPHLNGGPIRAIEEFMFSDDRFEIDGRWEGFFGSKNTNCPKGFLRRKS